MSEGAVTCPFCHSASVEVVGMWAGQLMTKQLRCRTCNSYYEAIREVFEASETEPRRSG